MRCVTTGVLLALLISCVIGCSNWTAAQPASAYVASPGQYAPPAQPVPKLRIAVPAIAIDGAAGVAPDVDLQASASDELFKLLDSSGRCDLTERLRLHQLLAEQGLIDMIQPGRLVHPAAVHGFDYILTGQITNLSVRRELPPNDVSVAGVENMLHIGQPWMPKLIASARVNLFLVNARTGAIELAEKQEFHRAAAPQDLGLQLTSQQLANASQVQLSPSDTHQIMRLALDEAVRPMLPRMDQWAAALPPPHESPMGSTIANVPATQPAGNAPQVIHAYQICPECGARVAADQEFCPVCGHKLH